MFSLNSLTSLIIISCSFQFHILKFLTENISIGLEVFFWGGGETDYLGFSYCLCFCDETWVYGFIELGMCLDEILFCLYQVHIWFYFCCCLNFVDLLFIEEVSVYQYFKYSVVFFFRFIIDTVIYLPVCLHDRRGCQVSL